MFHLAREDKKGHQVVEGGTLVVTFSAGKETLVSETSSNCLSPGMGDWKQVWIVFGGTDRYAFDFNLF